MRARDTVVAPAKRQAFVAADTIALVNVNIGNRAINIVVRRTNGWYSVFGLRVGRAKEVVMRVSTLPIWGVVFSLAGCSDATRSDSVESRTSAITSDEARIQRILGFESVSDWAVVTGTATISSTTIRTDGSAALAASVRNYNAIRSAPMGPLGVIGTSMSYDVFVPLQPSPPQWMGETQLLIDCPSRGIFNQFIGQRDLVNFPRGKYSPVTYNVPEAIRSALNGQTYTDLRFTVVLNVPSDASQLYRLDRFTVTPCGTGGVANDGSCQEAAPDTLVVSAADVANQGPEFTTVSAAINYISVKLQADPSLGTVSRIVKDEGEVPVSISLKGPDLRPIAVVEANRTISLYPSRFALLLGGRAGTISLEGGQTVCLKDRCDPVCPSGQIAGEGDQCVCSGGQATLPDSSCVCTDGHTLIDGTCQCPPDSFLSETGECIPLAEAAMFLPGFESKVDEEFRVLQRSYHEQFIPFISRWIPIARLSDQWGTSQVQLAGGYQESLEFCWKWGYIPWACTQKTGSNAGQINMRVLSGTARSPLFTHLASDFRTTGTSFRTFFGSLAINDAGGIDEGTGGDCRSPECDIDALCAAGSVGGNSTSRTGPQNRFLDFATGVNCQQ